MILADRKHFKFWIFTLAVILISLAVAGTAQAQEGGPGTVTDDDVNRVAKQLYCPVCENIPLDVCGTQACEQWRQLIREMLAEGRTDQEIKTYFVQQYGDRVLATPPARGLNWLVYIIPPAAFLAGAFVLYRAFRAWRQSDPEIPAETPPETPQDEYVARLEEELRSR